MVRLEHTVGSVCSVRGTRLTPGTGVLGQAREGEGFSVMSAFSDINKPWLKFSLERGPVACGLVISDGDDLRAPLPCWTDLEGTKALFLVRSPR